MTMLSSFFCGVCMQKVNHIIQQLTSLIVNANLYNGKTMPRINHRSNFNKRNCNGVAKDLCSIIERSSGILDLITYHGTRQEL